MVTWSVGLPILGCDNIAPFGPGVPSERRRRRAPKGADGAWSEMVDRGRTGSGEKPEVQHGDAVGVYQRVREDEGPEIPAVAEPRPSEHESNQG